MSGTNEETNTPGGTPVTQVNPPSSEVGLTDSGGDQPLLYYNYWNQSQDMLVNKQAQLSESENDNQNLFERNKRVALSPVRRDSPSIRASGKNIGSENEEKLINELCKANNALVEANSINKQLNGTIAWMQERMKTLENEVKALKTKEICPTTSQNTTEQEYHTDEDELARETEWIRVKGQRKKRKRNNTPSPPQLKELKDDVPNIIQKQPKKIPPPPPIVIDEVKDYDLFYEKIKKITTTDKFNAKVMNGNTIKINLEDGETYRKMTKMLNEEKCAWHTFEDKQTRPIRVMAKNLHSTCKPEKIIDDLKAKGFQATEASIKLKRRGKVPLNMFMLTFDTNEDIEKIYQIKYILGCKVVIQPLRRSKLIPQCKQCQAYGHTQKYCSREPRCVKCLGKHHTKDCVKDKNVQPKCVHCGENHPANYRGCIVAVELQNIKNRNVIAKNPRLFKQQAVKMNQPEVNRRVSGTTHGQLGKMTYAQVTMSNGNPGQTGQNDEISQTLKLILSRLNTFDERLQKLEYSAKGAIPKPRNGQ